MKMITGFLTPDQGSVIVAGRNIAEYPVDVKSRIGYLPEGAPLYSDMTPVSFLQFIAQIRGLKGADITRRVDEIIEKVNLQSVVHKSIETLSKGFKRRVGLAQAILHDPEVLILDEPTDGLDPNQKHEVRSLIRDMAAEKAIILSTHILEEVHAVCTRAMIITNGALVADGTPNSLEAKSPYYNSVEISVRTSSADPVQKALASISGVKSAEVLSEIDGIISFRVLGSGDLAPIAQVSQIANENNWQIEDLHVEKGRLDEVFRAITTQQVS